MYIRVFICIYVQNHVLLYSYCNYKYPCVYMYVNLNISHNPPILHGSRPSTSQSRCQMQHRKSAPAPHAMLGISYAKNATKISPFLFETPVDLQLKVGNENFVENRGKIVKRRVCEVEKLHTGNDR